MISSVEKQTGSLFGELWTALSDKQFADSVELFTKRAVANDFDLHWLKGKKCLDGGCGSGRYSVALALHGAAEVTAVDISDTGIEEAKRRAKDFPQIRFMKNSVLDLSFPDESFDFVWSAGVIHHTKDFDRALAELTRVLKPQGKLFLLVYGAGGLRWKVIKSLRPIVVDLGQDFIDRSIEKAGLPANNRKHFMDDLFVPVQKLTSFDELRDKLPELGYAHIDRWTGESFDHESNPKAQIADIEKLERITASAMTLAVTTVEQYLSRLAHETVKLYMDTAYRVLRDSALTDPDIRNIMIGEGNHRIVATKG